MNSDVAAQPIRTRRSHVTSRVLLAVGAAGAAALFTYFLTGAKSAFVVVPIILAAAPPTFSAVRKVAPLQTDAVVPTGTARLWSIVAVAGLTVLGVVSAIAQAVTLNPLGLGLIGAAVALGTPQTSPRGATATMP